MTKSERSAIARQMAGMRKTHGGPAPKCHLKPDPNCPRCQKRIQQRNWRAKLREEREAQR